MSAVDMLNELAEAQDAVATATREYEAHRRAVLARVQEDLDILEAEWSPKLTQGSRTVEELAKQIKLTVQTMGGTVRGDFLQAVWSKGRTTWNTDWLEGYAADHPEIREAMKVGAPSVSIRELKPAKDAVLA